MTSDGTHDWRCKAAVSTGISAASALVGMIVGRVIQNLKLRKLVNGNHRLLTKEDKKLVRALSAAGHGHIFRQWPAPGVRDGAKLSLVACLHEAIASPSVEKKRLELLKPPVPVKKPRKLEQHGDVREDGLYWLRDDARSDPEVLAHLRAENDYVKAAMADTEELQNRLFKEMRGRIQEADQTAAQRHGPYYYYSRMEEGKQYSVHCRRHVPPGAGPPSDADTPSEAEPEEVLLDENREAARHGGFYMAGAVVASPNHRLLAYSQDTSGNEKYTLFVKDLETGAQLLAEPIPDTNGCIVWANDNATLFYCKKDHLDRPFRAFRHLIGSGAAPGEDVCVYHEEDDAFYIGMFRSRDDQLLFISSGSAVTSEARFLSADTPDAPWTVVRPRQNEVEYSVEVRGQQLLMALRDASRPNSELLVAPLSDPSNPQVLVPHREDVKLEGFELSEDFLVLFERQQGLQTATVFALPKGTELAAEQLGQGERLEFDEPAYELAAGGQGDFDSQVLRLCYTSLTTPLTVLDHHMRTRGRTVKKVQSVLGGFESSNYRTERIWASAPDGIKVPISLVYNHHLAKLDGSDPLLLDIYGSYEVCNDPGFSSSRVSLLDRGFIFAIAHVRGGGEMGRRWYEDGKYLRKKNTFTDSIACAEHLVASRYTSANRLCIEGRSAGGLTMGAVLNMRPELFRAAVLGVPFVDVLTTMLDESIPLTTIEWEEWGNPVASRQFYDYMRSYSPLDNVRRAAYPSMLVTAGLHDPRVGYWEPAKLVAKLREFKTNDSLLLFKCDLGAGHFSQSGRFDRLKEVALEHAFLLKALGMLALQPFTPAPAQQ